MEPVAARYRKTVKRLYFRGDAAFGNPEMYEFLEAEPSGYTIRLPANSVLQDKSATSSDVRWSDRRTRCAHGEQLNCNRAELMPELARMSRWCDRSIHDERHSAFSS